MMELLHHPEFGLHHNLRYRFDVVKAAAKEFGLPQPRPRYYFVGVRRDLALSDIKSRGHQNLGMICWLRKTNLLLSLR
jgi:C-5 cytosine-specific DNA methylase.